MPYYDLRCRSCGAIRTKYFTYAEYDRIQKFQREGEDYNWDDDNFVAFHDYGVHFCDVETGLIGTFEPITYPVPVHLKGYGFYKTDNRSSDEKYDFDHFSDSGTNSEKKAMEHRIKNPDDYMSKGV